MATKVSQQPNVTYSPEFAPPGQQLSLCNCAMRGDLEQKCELRRLDEAPVDPSGSSGAVSAPELTLCACTGRVFVPQPEVPRPARTIPAPALAVRTAGAFTCSTHRLRYLLIVGVLAAAVLVVTALIFTWGNDFEFFSDKWWRVSKMRIAAIVVIATVTFAQAFATVSFQTVTNNRIITPSIMGFESLFILVQTAIVYFLGTAGLAGITSTWQFILQALVMVAFSVALYSWLLSGKLGNLHVMLLVGIVIGTGLGALSTFMQRMLDPNEFDILRARLFANIGSANAEILPLAVPVAIAAGTAIWLLGRRLNVLALGSQVSTNLGMNPKRQTMVMLTLVSVLMAVSTALVGPMTFLGFLTATMAYSVTDTHDHRRILPVAWLLGVVVLGLAYLLLKYVFPMVDAVMIIVELLGGLVFLGIIIKRGRL